MKNKKILIFVLAAAMLPVTTQPADKELVDILHGLAGEQQKEGRGIGPEYGQIGAIIQGYDDSVKWLPFEGESKIVDKSSYDTLRISPDRRFLAAGLYAEDKIDLWDLSKSYEKAKTIDGNIAKIHFSHDSRYMTTQRSTGNKIDVWSLEDIQAPQQEITTNNIQGRAARITFSPDSRSLIYSFFVSSGNNQFEVWDLENLSAKPKLFPFFGYSPQGKYKMLRGPKLGDGIQILDLHNAGKEVMTLDPSIQYAYFTPDERMVVGGSRGRTDLLDMQNIAQGPRALDPELLLSFSSTGKYVVVGEPDIMREKKLWETHNLYDKKTPLAAKLDYAIFSPNDSSIFLGTLGGENKVLNVANAAQNFTLNEPVSLAAFSPHGTYLVAGTGGDTITLFDIKNAGKKLATLDGSIYSFYFSPDERYLITLHNGIVITDLAKIVPELASKKEQSEPLAPKPPVEQRQAAASDADLMQSLMSLAEKLTDLKARLTE